MAGIFHGTEVEEEEEDMEEDEEEEEGVEKESREEKKTRNSLVVFAARGDVEVSDNLEEGEVVKIDPLKGFGFIRRTKGGGNGDGGKPAALRHYSDLFFHVKNTHNMSGVEVELTPGSRVQFRSRKKDGKEDAEVWVSIKSDLEKSKALRGGSWILGRIVRYDQRRRGFVVRPEHQGDKCKSGKVFLPEKTISKNLLKIEVRDEIEFLVGRNSVVRHAQIFYYSHRSRGIVMQFLSTMAIRRNLEQKTVMEILLCKPLWKLLVNCCEEEWDDEDDVAIRGGSSNSSCAIPHFCKFLSLILINSTGKIDTARTLLSYIMEREMFSDTGNGVFVKYIQSIQYNPTKTDRVTSLLSLCQDLIATILMIQPSYAYTFRHCVDIISHMYTDPGVQWFNKVYQLAAGNSKQFLQKSERENISLIPLQDELMGPLLENSLYLPIVRKDSPYTSEEEYINTYFSLYRTECFSAIQKGIKNFLKGELDERDMNVFYHLSLTGYAFSTSSLYFAIRFETRKKVNWRITRSLMYGNLLCLSPSGKFQDQIWATVADRHIDLLNSKEGPTVLIQLLPQFNTLSCAEIVMKLTTHRLSAVMVESPQYYQAFSHIVKCMQEFDMDIFPLKDEIVFCSNPDIPTYLKSSNPDISEAEPTVNVLRKTSDTARIDLDSMAELFEGTTLDNSQKEAAIHALTNRVAIIQGPPGCGKTFVGEKLLEQILSMDPAPELPILVLTSKNHALDEFLVAAQKFVPPRKMVRVGGRSKEEKLDQCNLKSKLKQDFDDEIQSQINKLRDDIQLLNTKIGHHFKELDTAVRLAIVDWLLAISEEQLFLFFCSATYGKGHIEFQFSKKKWATLQIVTSWIVSVANLKTELISLYRKKCINPPSRELKNCKMLLKVLLDKWTPSKSEYTTLQEMMGQYWREIRKSQNGGIDNSVEQTEDEVSEEFDAEFINNMERARLEAGGFSNSSNLRDKMEIEYFHKGNDTYVAELHQFPQNMVTDNDILCVEDLWNLSPVQRMIFLYTVLHQRVENLNVELDARLSQLETLQNSLKEVKCQQEAAIIRRSSVVGMTISGASIHHDVLREVQPRIVLVEEAGEVLECELLAALTPGIQHLILIGDHKQLRPKVETYKLRIHHNFDLSMMERLIKNEFPYKVLEMQNRMRPEFSRLLLPIYPKLQDNLDRVSANEPVKCVAKTMFFWDHAAKETPGRSVTNKEEAIRAIYLAEYILMNKYTVDRITILAAYQGQVTLIRREIHKLREQKKKMIICGEEIVKVSTIDMYQGDENDIVIISLVRSNLNGTVGFLRDESRMVVAQSRAKCGMYFLGDIETLTKKCPTWNGLIKSMTEDGCAGKKLLVQCPKHPKESRKEVTNSEMIIEIVNNSQSFCKYQCGQLLECGLHKCTKPCVSNHVHGACMVMVDFTFPLCGHVSQKRCHENVSSFKCETSVMLQFDSCDHEKKVKCFQKYNHQSKQIEILCRYEVKFLYPDCGHSDVKECCEKISDLRCELEVSVECPSCHQSNSVECFTKECVVCKHTVKFDGLCGHKLEKLCHQEQSDVQCKHFCQKMLMCGHPCSGKCSESCDPNRCNIIVYPKGLCGHEVKKKCSQNLSEAFCDFPCGKLRDCGHPCSKQCYKPCNSGNCQICLTNQNHAMEKSRHRAKMQVKKIQDQLKETNCSYKKVTLQRSDDTLNEYLTVQDKVLKYIVPMHGWFPSIVKIEKTVNLELEKKYYEAKMSAFGEFEDLKFHGTNDKGVTGICQDGFRIGSTPGMFGAGIYFATDSSKSSQEIYTKGSNKLLLCKVLLGRSKTVDRADNKLNLKNLRKDCYDSVFAPRDTKHSGGVVNDEFVIFDPRQAYPLYIIHYSKSTMGSINTMLNSNQPFEKVDVYPSRAVNMKNPDENLMRFAESHFYRMQQKYNGLTREIHHVTIVKNKNLFDKFSAMKTAFKREKKGEVIFAYHGTDPANVESILKDNFQQRFWSRQVHGPGNYFSEFPETSLGYGQGLILCEVLPGKEFKGGGDKPNQYDSKLVQPNADGAAQMVIITNPDQILPICRIHLR